MKRKMKKIMSAVLCATMIIPMISGKEAQKVQAQTAYTDVVSRADEPNIALSMGVMADSQYYGSVEHINKALQVFNTIDPNYDGIAMVGDITYMQGFASDVVFASVEEAKAGLYSDTPVGSSTYAVDADGQYGDLKGALNTYAVGKEYIYALGNHEFPLNSDKIADAATSEYITEASKQVFEEQMGQGMQLDKVFNGYHFIKAGPVSFSNILGEENETYIKTQVTAALAEEGAENKPIFVLLHKPFNDTTLGSTEGESCYSEDFVNFLKVTPQVVVLVGHTHYASNDPQKIWQDGFTQIDMGCTGGSMSHRLGKPDNGIAADWIEANYIEVTTDNIVYVHRISVQSGTAAGQTPKYIGNPYVLDIPAMVADANDGGEVDTNVWKYTDARKTNAVAPTFADTDKITVTAVTSNSATIQFPAATIATEDEEVISYRIQVINKKTSQQTQDYVIASDYYKTQKTNPFALTVDKLGGSTEYTIKVSAMSPWDKESKALSVNLKTTAKDASTTPSTPSENDDRETILQYVKDATASATVSTYGEGTGTYGWMFGAGISLTWTFEVPSSGTYELIPVAGVGDGGSLAVTVDGVPFGSITVPSGNSNAKNKISAGFYNLEAGTHTVSFKSNTGSSSIQMWSASLAKECDSVVTAVQASERTNSTITSGHANDISTAGRLAFWGNSSVTFNVNLLKSGTYDVYVDSGTSGDTTSWKAAIDGKTASSAIQNTGSYGTYCRTKLGSLELSKGSFTLTMTLTNSGTTSLRRVLFVQEDSIPYEIQQYAGTAASFGTGTNYGTSGDGWQAHLVGNSAGYISFAVTPEHTGLYQISWYYATGGSETTATTTVGGKIIDTSAYANSASLGSASVGVEKRIAHAVPLMAGKTYEIMIENTGAGTLGIERVVVNYVRGRVTLEDGIQFDAYVSNQTGGNVTVISGTGGTVNERGSMWGGKYITFEMDIEEAGLYNVYLQHRGGSDKHAFCVTVDGVVINDKATQIKTGLKILDKWGEIVLQAGKHQFRVDYTGSDGVEFHKLQLESVRGLTEADPYEVTIHAQKEYSKLSDNKTDFTTNNSLGLVLGGSGNWAEYTVDVAAGNYALSIQYGQGHDSALALSVNDEGIGNFTLPAGGSYLGATAGLPYVTKELGVLSLEEGSNTIRIARVANTKYFTFGSIKLTKIQKPISELYNGSYIVTDTALEPTFRVPLDGEMTARTYIPAYLEGHFVQVVVGVFNSNGMLVGQGFSRPGNVESNSVLVTNVKLGKGAGGKAVGDYTWEIGVLVQYTPLLAGIEDGIGAAEGTIIQDTVTNDRVLAANVEFKEEGATMTYRGMTLRLEGDNLVVKGLHVYSEEQMGGEAWDPDEEIVLMPGYVGLESFKNQPFELQITSHGTGEGFRVGIWVNQQLANISLFSADLNDWDETIAFTDGIVRYSAMRITEPTVIGRTYIELVGGQPYIVTADEFTSASGQVFDTGATIYAAGEYIAKSGVLTDEIVLWRRYDLNANGQYDSRDIVAAKKVINDPENPEALPTTLAGQMAASYLTSAYEMFNIRQAVAKQ